MANNNVYLFSVYRSSDDRLIVLDKTASECAKIMGIKTISFYHLCERGGINRNWTIVKEHKANIEKDIYE